MGLYDVSGAKQHAADCVAVHTAAVEGRTLKAEQQLQGRAGRAIEH